jgi:cytochrome c oxidase subunit 3
MIEQLHTTFDKKYSQWKDIGVNKYYYRGWSKFPPRYEWATSPFYTIQLRPWPAYVSLSAFFIASGLAAWFHGYTCLILIGGMLLLFLSLFQWFRDLVRELSIIGCDSSPIVARMRFGMVLFILSEVCFFAAFFWGFFHRRLSPTPQIGCVWPPVGIHPINPFNVPLLNTTVLLSSGISLTWAHHLLLEPDSIPHRGKIELRNPLFPLIITIGLGLFFTVLQAFEYLHAPFTIADGIYGTTFFVTTGFHGLHVIIGTIYLSVCAGRLYLLQFTATRHLGFEFAAWYWHFVDVIWILLFLSIYWWGS